MSLIIFFILIVLGLFFYFFVVIVPHQNVVIIERLGKYHKTMDSGLNFIIPIIDRKAYYLTLKEEAIDVPSQICITKDNVQVEVDGILYLKVIEPVKACYNIQDYKFSSIQLAQTNMRSEIGKLDLDQTFKEREEINRNMIRSLDIATTPWGVKITRYEIKNIIPPSSVISTMEKQMIAERDKRADIIYAEGEKIALINESEGKKIEAINISEGEKQKRINLAESEAKKIELISKATSESLRLIASALRKKGGNEALNLKIIEHYLVSLEDILKESSIKVLPITPAIIQSLVDGLSHLSNLSTKRDGLIPRPPHKSP